MIAAEARTMRVQQKIAIGDLNGVVAEFIYGAGIGIPGLRIYEALGH